MSNTTKIMGAAAIICILATISLICISYFPQIAGNKSWIDTQYRFTKAYITTGDKVIEVDIKKWNDYEGEQIQIISKDGTVYLVSSFNTVLVSE